MDINLVFVSGRLAVPAEFEWLSDGSRRVRLLVCVRSEHRSRFDVLGVTVPTDVDSPALAAAPSGSAVWIAGHLMRRCPPDPPEPPGRIEVVAAALRFPDLEPGDRLVDGAVDVEEEAGSR